MTTDYDTYVYLRNNASCKVQKAKSDFYTDSIAANSHQQKNLCKVHGGYSKIKIKIRQSLVSHGG